MNSDSKRAILAVILSGLILFGWQYFLGSNQPYDTSQSTSLDKVSDVSSENRNTNQPSESTNPIVDEEKLKIEKHTITDGTQTYVINNLLQITSVKGKLSKKRLKETFSDDKLDIKFKTNSDYELKRFAFTRVSDSHIDLLSEDSLIYGSVQINKKGLLSFNFESKSNFKINYIFTAQKVESEGFSTFGGKTFAYLDKDLETFSTDSDESGDAKIKWFGLDFDFHFFGIILGDDEHYLYRLSENGTMEVKFAKEKKNFSFDFVFVEKNYDLLVSLGDKLELTIDFGIWALIAIPILRGLQFFYTVIPNYGFSVILLTILIRMLTFPLQYKSFKSMKKMQVIQPELAKIKEKFKDDPKRQQVETMALFKKSGANPIGGCLPMLLQMPIFFAFYKVLYSSIELVGAPFMLWITDLSIKDPYYVLPVLMGIAMFFSQKLTPMTTTDPAQKKIMMFMPVIFSLMMINLPAALTLYIFVSTVMGTLQQIFVFKRT